MRPTVSVSCGGTGANLHRPHLNFGAATPKLRHRTHRQLHAVLGGLAGNGKKPQTPIGLGAVFFRHFGRGPEIPRHLTIFSRQCGQDATADFQAERESATDRKENRKPTF